MIKSNAIRRRLIFVTVFLSVVFVLREANCALLAFEGLQDGEQVENYYDGGTGSLGSTGSNFGVSFTSGEASTPFSNAPSPSTVIQGPAASIALNVSLGFDSFSFYYGYVDSGLNQAQVRIYDGPNATGNLLASTTLLNTSNSTFDFLNVPFSGIAHSAIIGGVEAYSPPVDNLDIGVVPEPATYILAALGTVALVICFRNNNKMVA